MNLWFSDNRRFSVRARGATFFLLSALLGSGCRAAGWMPLGLPPSPADGPPLCVQYYLTPAQGAAVLESASAEFDTRGKWERYVRHVRARIQERAGLSPWPAKTPLNPILGEVRTFDGYTVQNVALETVPGVFTGGNLYRPTRSSATMPAVLATHGHTPSPADKGGWAEHGRFRESVQRRAAVLARAGAVVLTLDMFGYGDSFTQFGAAAHRRPFSLTLQTWNARRALDFLESTDGVDRTRMLVTGESGGGTQSFLLTALDDRIDVSVPVVMVSAYHFGGCPCESGLPIHRSDDHFVNNAMIAAMAAPRPMLVVSDGKDWTQHTPRIEYPYLRKVYALFGRENDVENVHLPDEGHDYGPSKRAAMYAFVAKRLGLNIDPDESRIAVEPPSALQVFRTDAELPKHALRTAEAAEAALGKLQEK